MSLTPDYVVEAIDRWHEEHREGPRPHLGCSIAGDECARKIWLQFRLATEPKHSGRVLRIFRRGRREEEIVYEDLRSIGCVITDTQARVDFGAGVSGSMDGIISGGPLPPGRMFLLEIKTHKRGGFAELRKSGVWDVKPGHFAQMQLYMLGRDLDCALYLSICKDTDEIYSEFVDLDRDFAERIRDRAISIALSDDAPPRLSEDPAFWICKMCNEKDACHKVAENVNCRTCCHSTHTAEDKWNCARWLAEIPSFEAQLDGCEDHAMHPGCAPSWTLLEGVGDYSAVYRLPDGREVINGENGEPTISLVGTAQRQRQRQE